MPQPRQNQEIAQNCQPRAQSPRRRSFRRAFQLIPVGFALVMASGCAFLRPKPVEYEAFTLPSGVVVLDLAVPQKGPEVSWGDRVAIEYDLFLVDSEGAEDREFSEFSEIDEEGEAGEDGEMVDSTSLRGRPARFEVGAGEVPKGVEEGILGLRLFGQRRITVPPQAGYGDAGLPPRIPPQATLRFDVELVELESGAPEEEPVENEPTSSVEAGQKPPSGPSKP